MTKPQSHLASRQRCVIAVVCIICVTSAIIACYWWQWQEKTILDGKKVTEYTDRYPWKVGNIRLRRFLNRWFSFLQPRLCIYYAYEASDGRRVRHGPEIDFLKTGELCGRFQNLHGQLNGPFITYHPNGLVASCGRYESGNKHGTVTRYDANGHKKSEWQFANGKLHGKSLSWYPNGQLKQQMTWVNGKKEGRSLCWDAKGNVISDEYYESGTLISKDPGDRGARPTLSTFPKHR